MNRDFLGMSTARSHYSYSVYGLGVRSFTPLPDLVEADRPGDVNVRLGSVLGSDAFNALRDVKVFKRPGLKSSVSPDGIALQLDRVGTFLIRNGSEVLVEPEQDVLEEDLQPFLTGPVMAILLHQRGLMVLHASSILMNGSAVAFMGNKGYGKSTLAASFCTRGYDLVSDDLVPVSFENDNALTVPGFPKIKLYEDSIESVGSDPEHFPLIHRFVEKRSFRCAGKFSTEPVKLACIFVLATDDGFGIRELGKVPAFLELTRHTFLNHYLEALNAQTQHFFQCQRLLNAVPVFELKRPHRFDEMADVIAAVENQVAELSVKGKYEVEPSR